MSASTNTVSTVPISNLKETFHHKIVNLKDMIRPIGYPVQVHRIEVQCEDIDILHWLEIQTQSTKIYWSNRGGEFVVGGIGITDEIKETTNINYEELFEHLSQRFNIYDQNIRYYGGLVFNQNNTDWQSFGKFYFIIPRFEFTKRNQETYFACNISYQEVHKDSLAKIANELNQLSFDINHQQPLTATPQKRTDIPNKEKWNQIFTSIKKAIHSTNLQKVVLARQSTFQFNEPLHAFLMKAKLQQMTPECYHFCFQVKPDHVFLGASPEQLYKRQGTKIESEALAGTRPKSPKIDEDKKLKDELLSSPKEISEHQIVVDSIEKSLKPLCKALSHDTEPSLLELKWGRHLRTNFSGELNANITDIELLNSLHPTPAVAGYPVDQAVSFLNHNEPFERGWYAGVFGTISSEFVEFTVAIRSGLIQNNKLSLFAGAGIMAESDQDQEWDEIEAKMNSFFTVFDA